MKKFTSLLIGCSLALAGAAMAQQQPDQQPTPKNKKPPKTHQTEVKPEKTVAKPEVTPGKQHGAKNQHGALKDQNAEMSPKTEGRVETTGAGEANATATPGGKGEHGKHEIKERAAVNEKTSGNPVNSNATSSVAPGNERKEFNRQANAEGKAKQKPAPEKLHEIKTEHANFHAQPRPDKAPAVTFNASYRIRGSDRWQGGQYEAFRSYHPERHDQGWYRSHYHRVELIGGGYYYWNNGYWYPAWGYDSSAEYYAYDGPIYVGQGAEPPDQVIADVQSELQEMGYYQGEVDGLLGPLTQEALTAYQNDHQLEPTAAIDEPTLDSLGMNS